MSPKVTDEGDEKNAKGDKAFSQTLRKNATKEENHLWYDFLRTHPLQFRRQVPFGRYIVDFYCAKARLVIELDGSQHYVDRGPECDAVRTQYLQREHGLQILRFTNLDVKKNFEGVCAAINAEIAGGNPSSAPVCTGAPSPQRVESKKTTPSQL